MQRIEVLYEVAGTVNRAEFRAEHISVQFTPLPTGDCMGVIRLTDAEVVAIHYAKIHSAIISKVT